MNDQALLADRYELGERLGVGGMSTVVAAFDHRLERPIAIKLLAEHLADDPQFVVRFRREALAAARLVHPNVVQVFDFGLDGPSGRQYIAMELVTGPSVATLLRERGRLPSDEALEIIDQACRGLEYAHRNGVVHRDVKPGNLLQSDDGLVKLADFGIAKALADESSITQIGSVLGTAAYLAPEQAAGEPSGPAADLYSLGVVTYQLLSGRLPYEARSLTELALSQQRERPPLLGELVEVPAELAAAVDRALALDARARWQSAEEMRRSLADGARGRGTATRPLDVTAATVAARRPGAPPTAATRMTPRSPAAPTIAQPARQARVARPAPAPPPTPTRSDRTHPQRRPAARRRRRGTVRRLVRMLVVLVLLAAGGAAAVIATSNSDGAVRLREVVYDNVGQAVDEMQQLVEDNTR